METILIFIWGMFGGLLRFGITNVINYHVFPIATLVINLTGAFTLPLWNTYLGKRLKLSPRIIRSFGTGLIGSFTTFSGIMLDAFKLIEVHQILFLIIYLGLTITLGIILAIYGNQLAIKLNQKKGLKS